MSESVIDQLVLNMRVQTGDVARGLATGMSQIKAFAGAAGTAALGVVAFGVATGIGAVYSLRAMTLASMDAMGASAKLAARLGSDVEKYQSLSFAVKKSGDSVEDLGNVMSKMTLNIGSGKAKDALESMGLDPAKLKQQDPSDTFRTIAANIAKIKGPYAQADLAQQIFSKGSKEMMNTLRAGGEALDANIEKYKAMNGGLTSIDYANVRKANGAIGDLHKLTEAYGNLLASELSPYITAIVERMIEWKKQTIDLRGHIQTGMKVIAMAVGVVADTFAALEVVFGFIEVGFNALMMGLNYGLGAIVKAIEYAYGKMTGKKDVDFGGKGFDKSVDYYKDKADEGVDHVNALLLQKPPSEGIMDTFNKIGDEAKKATKEVKKAAGEMTGEFAKIQHSIEQLTEKLKLEYNAFGLTGDELEIYKLKMEAAKLSTVEQAKAMAEIAKAQDIVDNLEATKEAQAKNDEMINNAKAVREANKDEGEKYADERVRLKDMLEGGTLQQADYDKALDNLSKKFVGFKEGPQLASLAQEDSQEARKIQLQFQYGDINTGNTAAEKLAIKQLAEEKAGRLLLKKMADNPVPIFAFGH